MMGHGRKVFVTVMLAAISVLVVVAGVMLLLMIAHGGSTTEFITVIFALIATVASFVVVLNLYRSLGRAPR